MASVSIKSRVQYTKVTSIVASDMAVVCIYQAKGKYFLETTLLETLCITANKVLEFIITLMVGITRAIGKITNLMELERKLHLIEADTMENSWEVSIMVLAYCAGLMADGMRVDSSEANDQAWPNGQHQMETSDMRNGTRMMLSMK